jgi:hypothetical protein
MGGKIERACLQTNIRPLAARVNCFCHFVSINVHCPLRPLRLFSKSFVCPFKVAMHRARFPGRLLAGGQMAGTRRDRARPEGASGRRASLSRAPGDTNRGVWPRARPSRSTRAPLQLLKTDRTPLLPANRCLPNQIARCLPTTHSTTPRPPRRAPPIAPPVTRLVRRHPQNHRPSLHACRRAKHEPTLPAPLPATPTGARPCLPPSASAPSASGADAAPESTQGAFVSRARRNRVHRTRAAGLP